MLSQDTRDRIKDFNLDIKLEYLEDVLRHLIEKIIEEKKGRELAIQPLMTITEVSEKFKVTKTTIQNWRRRELIVGTKIGKNRYFTHEEINAALKKYGWHCRLNEWNKKDQTLSPPT
ncbi:MAG: hypothetical protein NVS3B13_36050 [Mucilaginibacter sp.]